MLKPRPAMVLVCLAVLFLPAWQRKSAAQTPAPPQSVRLDIVLERYKGEAKVSSLPFSVVSDWQMGCSLRVGVDVPIGSTTETQTNTSSNTTTTTTHPEYKNIGTSIDCSVRDLAGGQYGVMVSLSDSSIYDADRTAALVSKGLLPQSAAAAPVGQHTAFETVSLRNRMAMRDGQTAEFDSATDKINGETLKLEVTLHVLQ